MPDQIPRLWLQQSGIVPATGPAPVVEWVDSSVHQVDADQVSQPVAPQVNPFSGFTWVTTQGQEFVKPPKVLPFYDNWALMVVSQVLHLFGPAAPSVSLCAFPIPSSPLALTTTQVRVWPGTGGAQFVNNPVGYSGLHLWSLRCEDGAVRVDLDGTLLGELSLLPQAAFRLTCCNGIASWGAGTGFTLVGYVKLYDAWLSLEQYLADLVAIKAAFGIP